MEPNKILSANILDLIFDGRNKEYGAYELRVTYPERIKKSMIVVFIIGTIAITGAALGNSFKPGKNGRLDYTEVTLADIQQDTKEPEPIPEPPKKVDPPRVRTEIYLPPRIVKDNEVPQPAATLDDLQNAKIGTKQMDGLDYTGETELKDIDEGKGIIQKKEVEDLSWTGPVEIEAQYDGDWPKFLTTNLRSETSVENGAAIGKYTVMIQFVVDQQGNVSDITALTNYGFGMEQEAIRVLKKAKKWKPGIQNGREVKSYRKQPITFVVQE